VKRNCARDALASQEFEQFQVQRTMMS